MDMSLNKFLNMLDINHRKKLNKLIDLKMRLSAEKKKCYIKPSFIDSTVEFINLLKSMKQAEKRS